MAEWFPKRLDEIVEFNPRETIKKGVIAKKIAMDKLKPFCRDITEFEPEPFSGGTKFRNGDTIMARITPCLENGKTAKVNVLDDGEVGFGSTEYIVFRAKEGVDADFVYYLISSPLVREPAIKSMVGSSGRQRVQTDVVQGITVMVPVLEEQKAIAGILKLLDDKIDVNRKINDNLAEQMAAIFINARDSSMWLEQKIENIMCFYDHMRKPLSSLQRNGMERNYPYYGAASIVDYVENYIFDGTYILISEDGANVVDKEGHPLTQYAYGKFWANNHAHIVQGINGFSEALLFALLKTLNIQSIVTGAAQPKVNQANLRNFVTFLPKPDEAEQLAALLEPFFNQMIVNDKVNASLTKLRDTLLPKLMSGELDVSNLNL